MERTDSKSLPTVVRLLTVLCLAASVTSAGRLTAASVEWTDFQGTDDFLFDPAIPPSVLLDAIECIHGQPTQNPALPCTLGSALRIRDVVSQSMIVSTDSRFTGIETISVNANFDPQYAGEAWGQWSLVVGGGTGRWKGVWQGKREYVPHGSPAGADAWLTHIRLVGEGSGSVEGLHVLASETIATYSPIPFPYEALGFCPPGMCPPEGSIVGRIF